MISKKTSDGGGWLLLFMLVAVAVMIGYIVWVIG